MFGKVKKIHFVGIGGIGMSGIAEVLKNMGFEVSGSDLSENANVLRLKDMGVRVFKGHNKSNVDGVDVVVYSSAVRPDNPELVAASEMYIPCIRRGEMLAELMRMKYSIVVAGSHGKTTTTSMLAEIFKTAELDPTIVIGGRLNSEDNNASLGKSLIMISEADESDRSFLILYPTFSVITNIDLEHLDCYKDMDDIKGAFAEFANRVPFYGKNFICLDDENCADIFQFIKRKVVTYGLRSKADITVSNIKKDGFRTTYNVTAYGQELGEFELNFPGEHNISNSLAAIGISLEFSIDVNVIKAALKNFKGVQRRLSKRFETDNVVVFDDYGHHPTEIKATLKAIREAYENRKVVVVFQPHRYTRTRLLMNDFAKSFFNSDMVFVTDIYAASEDPIEGVHSQVLVEEIKKHGFKDVFYLGKESDFFKYYERIKDESLVIVTLGAGSITKFSFEIAEFLGGGVYER
ncbi:UDP-N-acetylmuramate--L-alanine ligase [Deferribacteraceae bacterium V6Fe1]|nr:UDP-N-acetylmuramate--L-alanine ligase [Deferribacteraceae bacterium V6Fe1]